MCGGGGYVVRVCVCVCVCVCERERERSIGRLSHAQINAGGTELNCCGGGTE